MKCFTLTSENQVEDGIKIENATANKGEFCGRYVSRSLVKLVPVSPRMTVCQCHCQNFYPEAVLLADDLADTACRFSNRLFNASVRFDVKGQATLVRESGEESNKRALVLLCRPPEGGVHRDIEIDPRMVLAGSLSRGCASPEKRENRVLIGMEPGEIFGVREYISELSSNKFLVGYDGRSLILWKELPRVLDFVFRERILKKSAPL